jgi:hypothetical protein
VKTMMRHGYVNSDGMATSDRWRWCCVVVVFQTEGVAGLSMVEVALEGSGKIVRVKAAEAFIVS